MEKSPKIAVIIPTVNRRGKLAYCLSCLKKQTYQGFQVYVVNNGSTDGTEEMIKKEFQQVKLLNFKKMLGSAGGYKKGLERAFKDGFDWFWLMDDDAWPAEDALGKIVEISKLDEKKVFASVGLDDEKTGLLSWDNFLLKGGKKIKVDSYDQLGSSDLVESNGIGYIGLFLSRKVIEKVGYPDENMFTWVDDVDYFLRIRQAGFRMFFVRKSSVYHPRPDYQNISFLFKSVKVVKSTPWKEYYALRNSIYVWLKYDSKIKTLFFKIPKQFILYLILTIFFRSEKWKRLGDDLLAFKDGIIGNLGIREFSK